MTVTRRDFGKAALAAGALLVTGPRSGAAAELIRRPIPSTGEMIPIVGLGTNRYGVGDAADARAPLREVLARFQDWGGTVIDTAPMYRSSESVLGNLIEELGIRSDLFVATKVDREGRNAAGLQIRDSMQKLKTDTLDLLQVHNLRGWRESIPLLHDHKSAGHIRYIGITTSRPRQYEEMEMIMRLHGLDFVQLNYSLEQRGSAERLMPLAVDRGMAVIINRAFGGGRIFDIVRGRPLPEWTRDLDIESWAQFLLKYALSHPASTVAIPGMTKAHHVDDNFGAAQGPMPNATQRRNMETFFDAL